MKLSEFAHGRDNNFNLIRVMAAFAVLISHSFGFVIGPEAEPLRYLGTTLGTVGVDIFFVTSGFLVTGSLLSKKSAIEFLWARTLRIYPALVVMVFLTVFGLGIFFTTLPLDAYLAKKETYMFLLKNSIMLTDVQYTLPGVFEFNRVPKAVNGSLWSMPIEIRMYLILVALWIGARVALATQLKVLEGLILLLTGIATVAYLPGHFPLGRESHFSELFFMFFVGASYYVLKRHITLSWPAFLLCIVCVVLSSLEMRTFFIVYNLALAYMLFFVAYVPSGGLRSYNRVGDYSYGVYIYAFPIQQSVSALIPGVSVLQMVVISSIVTLGVAALSWHYLERHALKLKSSYVDYSTRLVDFFTKVGQR